MEINPNLTGKSLRDFRLVQSALAGNQRAYGQLLESYYDVVYKKMLRMTTDTFDADDLTIEAFSKAFSKLSQYTPDFAFSTWLFRVATNNCIDYLRRHKKEDGIQDNPEDLPPGSFDIPCEQPGPEAALIRLQEVAQLRNIVTGLKPTYRQLIELYYFEEHSVDEIAEELNLPEGTVKVRLFRARELLYNMLKEK
jgi:RNA polymerase sigma factor (sigma-70 family)